MPATMTPPAAARQPKDPDAVTLATAARELARSAGLKSAYTSGEGREVLNRFALKRARGFLTVTKDGGEAQRVRVSEVRAFLQGEGNQEVADLMAALAKDTKGTLYGRKLAAFLLAAADA